MSSFRRCSLALALAAGLWTATPAQAQSSLPDPGTFDLTPFLGFGLGFSDDVDDVLDGGAFTLGVAGAYHFTTQVAIEGELGLIPDIAGDTSDLDISIQTFSANGLYHFATNSPVIPYATLGLGFARGSVEIEGDDDSNTEFAINFGGGVKYPFTDRLAVRGDLRYFSVNDDNPNFWRVYGGVTIKLGQ